MLNFLMFLIPFHADICHTTWMSLMTYQSFTRILISYQRFHSPVSWEYVSAMEMSDVDIFRFMPHSTRSVSVNKAASGLSGAETLCAAGWRSVRCSPSSIKKQQGSFLCIYWKCPPGKEESRNISDVLKCIVVPDIMYSARSLECI